MRRVTVELMLTEIQAERARLQSATPGERGTFDAAGLCRAGIVDLDYSAITILEIEEAAGQFGVESWSGLGPTVADVVTTWYDSAEQRERQVRKMLAEHRSVRYVNRNGS